jgi:hypothetical protein
MTANRRIPLLERDAVSLLTRMGYDATVFSTYFQRGSHFIPYNLIAYQKNTEGKEEHLWVKVKIAMHRLGSVQTATIFCHDEIQIMHRFFDSAPVALPLRYEVWVSLPTHEFQRFEITREGFCELPAPVPALSPGGVV